MLRAELGSERYRDLEFRGAYIGHLIVDEKEVDNGCPVQVVGPGTPADEAGIQVGDRIVAVGSVDVDSPARLREAMRDLRPGRSIEVVVRRSGEEITLPIELRRRPLEVIRPEANDPLSMLVTLHEIDGQTLPDEKALYAEIAPRKRKGWPTTRSRFPIRCPRTLRTSCPASTCGPATGSFFPVTIRSMPASAANCHVTESS